MTLLHIVTYLCMKFEVTSFNTFEVMPRTRFRDAGMDGQGDSGIPPPNFVCGDVKISAIAHIRLGIVVEDRKWVDTLYFPYSLIGHYLNHRAPC